MADFPESGQGELRSGLALGEDGDGLDFGFSQFHLAGNKALAGVLSLARRVVHEREQVDGALGDQGFDDVANFDTVAGVFVAKMDASAGQRMLGGHRTHAGDNIAAGKAGGSAALGVSVAHVQGMVNGGDSAGDELAVEFVDRDIDGEVGAGPRRDFLFERVGVEVDEARKHIGAAGIHDLDVAGVAIGEFGRGAEGGDETAFREQGVVGENAGRSNEGGVGDEPAAHG